MHRFHYQTNAQRKVLCVLKTAASRFCTLEACDVSYTNSLQLHVDWDKFLLEAPTLSQAKVGMLAEACGVHDRTA